MGQVQEYDVLGLARTIAGEGVALQCISVGGCQIMGFNYPKLGYQSAREMYAAFQESESAQVRGFFSFCEQVGQSGELVGVPYEINLPGTPRVPGGRGFGKKYPDVDKGLDCSGFVLNVLQRNGRLVDLDPDSPVQAEA
jgi:hypothetical protein